MIINIFDNFNINKNQMNLNLNFDNLIRIFKYFKNSKLKRIKILIINKNKFKLINKFV